MHVAPQGLGRGPLGATLQEGLFLACVLASGSLITLSSVSQSTYFSYNSYLAFPVSLTTLYVLLVQRMNSVCLAVLARSVTVYK